MNWGCWQICAWNQDMFKVCVRVCENPFANMQFLFSHFGLIHCYVFHSKLCTNLNFYIWKFNHLNMKLETTKCHLDVSFGCKREIVVFCFYWHISLFYSPYIYVLQLQKHITSRGNFAKINGKLTVPGRQLSTF